MFKKLNNFVKHPEFKHFVLYLIMAIIGFSTNVGSRVFYREVLGIDFGVSVVLAYFTGMIVGFVLSKLFVFKAQANGNIWREMIKFTLVSVVAMLVTLVGSLIALNVFNWYFEANPEQHKAIVDLILKVIRIKAINRELASHLAGTCVGFFANFFGHKLFTFRSTGYWDKLVTAKTQHSRKA